MNVREKLKGGGASPRWIWYVFRLWTCGRCEKRFRSGNDLTRHETQCDVTWAGWTDR